MPKFRKAILRTGRYHSPDGVVDVTPDRLRNWERQFARMQQSRQVVPIDWDHADTAEALQPLTMDAYHQQRSAQRTIGHLADFRVNEAGDAAEITLDLRTPKAVEAAELNTVYVSPVLFPEWRDGAGHVYKDVITHVDMVNHPVDHSQSPFVAVEPQTIACALRMSLNAKPYRLSEDCSVDEDQNKKPDLTDEPADPVDDAAETPPPATPPEGASTVKDIIDSLRDFNIVLQEGTNASNLVDRLHAALLTAKAHQGKGEEPGPGQDPAAQQTKIEDPAIATMSLQAQTALRYAEATYRGGLAKRLKLVADTGRCTPVEAKQWEPQLTAVKLSLDAQTGRPHGTRLEDWIASREAVPQGTFWSPEQKLSLAQATVLEPPPAMRGDLTQDEIRDAADWALGKRK